MIDTPLNEMSPQIIGAHFIPKIDKSLAPWVTSVKPYKIPEIS